MPAAPKATTCNQ